MAGPAFSNPISIKDIAKAAGVSHSTVSRALADSPLVASETKQRIQRIAREMGYTPSAIARGLVTKRTATVGLVVTTIADPFIAEVAQGIEETALDNGYNVILCNCSAEPEREVACARALREKRVDAIIVTSSRVGSLYVPLLEELGVPIVLINNQHEGDYVYSVRTDNLTGGRLAGEYLLSLGHRHVAYIAGPPGAHSSKERLEGCRVALREHGLDIPDDWVAPGDGRTGGGQAGVDFLLRRSPQPTAIFCYNDMTAIGALQAIKRAGLRVPDDFSLVGYDDIAFAAFVDPPLTTIAQDKYTLGQRAMDLALELLNGQEEAGDIVLTPYLVERASCAPTSPGVSQG
ncbi:MAG TPA: LacI family transcriptional regulator [Thermoflexia bacterium]|nr:LacI family transcriptional regulator [Thermoflexia bacterium]